MKKYVGLIFVFVAGLLFSGCSALTSPSRVACTQEAKLCPDGSSVGRTGPHCEFAPCSSPTSQSGIQGKVMLGPTCPVMRIPPDLQCAEKPYQTQFVLSTQDQSQVIKAFSSDAQGKFRVDVPVGIYVISPAPGANMLPRCNSTSVTVGANSYTDIIVSCDTGIR